MKSKVWFIDYLRIIAALAVVLIHTASNLSFKFGQIPSSKWWAANLISSATHWAVPMFIMISGYLLLDQTKHLNTIWKKFYISRLKRIGLPLLFWIIIYAIFHYFTRHDPLSFSFVIKRIIFDQPYEHLFFLVVLFQLAIITPFLSKIINPLKENQLGWLTLIFLFISIFWKPSRFIISLFVPYLGYYLGGYWLKKKKINISDSLSGIFITILIFLMAIGTYVLVSHSSPDRNGLYFYTYFNPLIILLSLIIFIFFQNKKEKLTADKRIAVISNTTLGIYLIHPILLELFDFITIPDDFFSALLLLLIKGSLVFIISGVITAIYQRLKLAILRL